MASFKIGRSMLRQLLSATISFIAERTKSGKRKRVLWGCRQRYGKGVRFIADECCRFCRWCFSSIASHGTWMYIAQLPPRLTRSFGERIISRACSANWICLLLLGPSPWQNSTNACVLFLVSFPTFPTQRLPVSDPSSYVRWLTFFLHRSPCIVNLKGQDVTSAIVRWVRLRLRQHVRKHSKWALNLLCEVF